MPRRAPPAALALAAAGAAVVVACTLPYQRQVNAERKVLEKYLPATIEATAKFEGEVRVAKVRVYADELYRTQNLRWQDTFGDELDYANQLFEPMLGVRLEPEFKAWAHRSDGPLKETLDALVALDPGDDVAWVIGLTGSLEMVSNLTDDLGMAYELRPHLVLRGFSDVAERKLFDKALPDLETAEREELYHARRRHKQTAILVHELGHTLGAIHETDPSWLMHPKYDIQMARESDRNRALMLLALADRLAGPGGRDPGAVAARVLAAIEQDAWGGWIPAERDAMTEQLRNIVDAAKQGQTAVDVPSAVYGQYDHARGLAMAGKLDDAVAELESIIAAYPANATLRLLRCEIELRRAGPGSAAATAACDRAIELAGGDPRPHFLIATAYLGGHDVASARRELEVAEGKIANLPRPADGWVQLAGFYQSMGAIAWAERAIAKAGVADHPILAWARSTRARYGVPATGAGAVDPAEEADAVAAVRQVLDAVYASKFADAERAARAAAKRWRHLPGLAAARCDLALRQNEIAAARKHCAAAITAYPDASWAQYLAGILALRGTRTADTATGIDHLRKAIAVDPELGQAWRALGKAYARAKDDTARAKLAADYQARFGQALGD